MKLPKISWGRIKLGRIGLFDSMFVKKDMINGLSISDEMTSGNVNLSKNCQESAELYVSRI